MDIVKTALFLAGSTISTVDFGVKEDKEWIFEALGSTLTNVASMIGE